MQLIKLSKPIQGPLSFWGPGVVDYSAWLKKFSFYTASYHSLKLKTIYSMSIAVTC